MKKIFLLLGCLLPLQMQAMEHDRNADVQDDPSYNNNLNFIMTSSLIELGEESYVFNELDSRAVELNDTKRVLDVRKEHIDNLRNKLSERNVLIWKNSMFLFGACKDFVNMTPEDRAEWEVKLENWNCQLLQWIRDYNNWITKFCALSEDFMTCWDECKSLHDKYVDFLDKCQKPDSLLLNIMNLYLEENHDDRRDLKNLFSHSRYSLYYRIDNNNCSVSDGKKFVTFSINGPEDKKSIIDQMIEKLNGVARRGAYKFRVDDYGIHIIDGNEIQNLNDYSKLYLGVQYQYYYKKTLKFVEINYRRAHMYNTVFLTYYGRYTRFYYNDENNRQYADIDGTYLTFVQGKSLNRSLDGYKRWFRSIKDLVSNNEVCVTLIPSRNQDNNAIAGEDGNSYVFELTKNQSNVNTANVQSGVTPKRSDDHKMMSDDHKLMPKDHKIRIPVTLGQNSIISINTIYYVPITKQLNVTITKKLN